MVPGTRGRVFHQRLDQPPLNVVEPDSHGPKLRGREGQHGLRVERIRRDGCRLEAAVVLDMQRDVPTEGSAGGEVPLEGYHVVTSRLTSEQGPETVLREAGSDFQNPVVVLVAISRRLAGDCRDLTRAKLHDDAVQIDVVDVEVAIDRLDLDAALGLTRCETDRAVSARRVHR